MITAVAFWRVWNSNRKRWPNSGGQWRNTSAAGHFPAELNHGVHRLVGWLQEPRTLGFERDPRRSRRTAYGGTGRPRYDLRRTSRNDVAELRRFRTQAGLPDRLVRQAMADEVQRAVREVPIVVLVGQGGTGKCALLETVLQEFLVSRPTAGYASAEFGGSPGLSVAGIA